MEFAGPAETKLKFLIRLLIFFIQFFFYQISLRIMGFVLNSFAIKMSLIFDFDAFRFVVLKQIC